MHFRLDEPVGKEMNACCTKYCVRSLKLFGSGAREDFDAASSDLDFLVEFNEPPAGMRLSTQFFGFLEELEQVFGRHVDLLEEPAIENSVLRKQALESAVTLYAA